MDFTLLDRYLESLLGSGLPMYDCTVHINYKEVYRRQGGYIDVDAGKRHHPHTRYFMYSATKPVTCAAALTLLEAGAFRLGDPLFWYLPEYEHMQVADRKPGGCPTLRPAETPIRIRDLFQMTAGMTYNIHMPALREAIRETGGRAPTREIARAMAREPLSFDPGDRWQYGFCHDVLAALVEAVSGERFGDYVHRVIFSPLGMEHSSFHAGADTSDMAAQYRYNDVTKKPHEIDRSNPFIFGEEYDSGGGGMVSTVEDYIRFADMLANGGVGEGGVRILSAAAVELMGQNGLSQTQARSFTCEGMEGRGYGLGVSVHTAPGVSGSLSPVGEFGWGGAAGSAVYIDPSSRTAVFYAQHVMNAHEERVMAALRNVVFGCLGR